MTEVKLTKRIVIVIETDEMFNICDEDPELLLPSLQYKIFAAQEQKEVVKKEWGESQGVLRL